MMLFEYLASTSRLDNDWMNLSSELSTSPRTPDNCNGVVKMIDFDLHALREAILNNIKEQGLGLLISTWKDLVKLLDGEFGNETKQIYLQVLVHWTKMDVALMNNRPDSNGKLPKADVFFDKKISDFVQLAIQPITPLEEIVLSSDDVSKTKEILKQNAVLSAVECALNQSVSSSVIETWNREKIQDEIDRIRVFTVEKFFPLQSLRGAALLNGILLCHGKIAGIRKSVNFESDYVTLVCHEFTHYLARKRFQDFNFSSPWKYLDESTKCRFDQTERKLELGRDVELLLFHGVQPDWANSLPNAARTFLDRLSKLSKYPLIDKTEHKMLGLKERPGGTLAFGIDFEEDSEFSFE